MDPNSSNLSEFLNYTLSNLVALHWHHAALGLAEAESLSPALNRRLKALHGIISVFRVSRKEMLGIKNDFLIVGHKESHCLTNHLKVFFESRMNDVRNLKVPGLSENANDLSFRRKKTL